MIAYCRIGERSSHTWFVLKYLLGVGNVVNYDGSWTEWGNLVGAPVERGVGEIGGTSVKPENYSERKVEVDGWQVNLTTYQLGDEVALQGGQRIARCGAGPHCRRHTRRRGRQGAGARERAAVADPASYRLGRYRMVN